MSADLSLLSKKKPLLNSISMKANEIQFSKDINSDKITCSKLICDDIEINNSGETKIDNATITNSKINNTSIGTIFPSTGIFNKFQMKSGGNLDTSFIIDSDITIANLKFLDQVRNINSFNPLKLSSNQYLLINSKKYTSINSAEHINISAHTDLNLIKKKKLYLILIFLIFIHLF